MRLGAIAGLIVATVTITVSVQHFFKPAAQVDLQLENIEFKMESAKSEILKEMTIRREGRDKEFQGLKEEVAELKRGVKSDMESVNRRLDTIFDWMLEKQRQNEAMRSLASERDGS